MKKIIFCVLFLIGLCGCVSRHDDHHHRYQGIIYNNHYQDRTDLDYQ